MRTRLNPHAIGAIVPPCVVEFYGWDGPPFGGYAVEGEGVPLAELAFARARHDLETDAAPEGAVGVQLVCSGRVCRSAEVFTQ